MTTPADEEPWAATRDASWYDRPNVRSDKAVHVGRPDGWSRCGRSFLDDGSTWAPEDVPEHIQCRANGCRQAWPTTAAARTTT
jgi:hypothetical protein